MNEDPYIYEKECGCGCSCSVFEDLCELCKLDKKNEETDENLHYENY